MLGVARPRRASPGASDDLKVAVGLALLCAAVVIIVPSTPVRVIFTVPLCLLLPGFALRSALFVGEQLEPAPRLLLIPGLSLVTLILGALVLNELPGGIRKGTWVGWLLLVILAAAGVTARRRGSGGPAMAGLLSGRRVRAIDAGLLLLALLVGVGALVASRIPLSARNIVGYETLALRPNRLNTGAVVTVTADREHTYTYGLNVAVGLHPALSRTLRLAPGASFSVTVAVPPRSRSRSASATLRVIGSARPGREVNLTLGRPR